jgi:hypothetical protein
VHADLPAAGVDGQRAVLADRVGARRPAADRADPGDQLADAERPHQVVVGAQPHAAHQLGLVAARGERDQRRLTVAPQPAAHVGAVEVGQAESEQDHVGWRRGRRGAAGGHVIGDDAVPGQAVDQRFRDRRVVLHQQHPHTPWYGPGGLRG